MTIFLADTSTYYMGSECGNKYNYFGKNSAKPLNHRNLGHIKYFFEIYKLTYFTTTLLEKI